MTGAIFVNTQGKAALPNPSSWGRLVLGVLRARTGHETCVWTRKTDLSPFSGIHTEDLGARSLQEEQEKGATDAEDP